MGFSEADTRVKLIDPRLASSGWSESVIEREYTYRRGGVRLVGEQSIRDQAQYCDYVLRDGARGPILAVVEAKDEDHAPSDGLQQALGYAVDLDTRLEAHREGRSGKTTRYAFELGITFTLARTWSGSLSLERRINSNGPSNYCPLCPRWSSGSSPSNLIGANGFAGEDHSQGSARRDAP